MDKNETPGGRLPPGFLEEDPLSELEEAAPGLESLLEREPGSAFGDESQDMGRIPNLPAGTELPPVVAEEPPPAPEPPRFILGELERKGLVEEILEVLKGQQERAIKDIKAYLQGRAARDQDEDEQKEREAEAAERRAQQEKAKRRCEMLAEIADRLNHANRQGLNAVRCHLQMRPDVDRQRIVNLVSDQSEESMAALLRHMQKTVPYNPPQTWGEWAIDHPVKAVATLVAMLLLIVLVGSPARQTDAMVVQQLEAKVVANAKTTETLHSNILWLTNENSAVRSQMATMPTTASVRERATWHELNQVIGRVAALEKNLAPPAPPAEAAAPPAPTPPPPAEEAPAATVVAPPPPPVAEAPAPEAPAPPAPPAATPAAEPPAPAPSAAEEAAKAEAARQAEIQERIRRLEQEEADIR